jgi:hypothetical protein
MDFNPETTKRVCTFMCLSLFLLVLSVLTPLSKPIKTLALLLLGFTVYLNVQQTTTLTRMYQTYSREGEAGHQLTMNVVCSYLLTLFLVTLMACLSARIFW